MAKTRETSRSKRAEAQTAMNARERDELKALALQIDELAAAFGGEAMGAGIPQSASLQGRTMLAMQKFRVDWFAMPRKALFEVAALLVERHWFVNPVAHLNVDLYGMGFRFEDPEAREDKALKKYPFARVARDLLLEYQTTTNAVALWLKNDGHDELPLVCIPDLRDCEMVGGSLKMSFRANRNLPESDKERFGAEMWTAMKQGKTHTLKPDDERWRFRIFTDGKYGAGFNAPSLTGILDDLDFIEAIKVGDWNGAFERRKMILQALRGYAITSGSNAGITRGHAKRAQLEAIAKWLKQLVGAGTLATNFDQEFKRLIFPTKDHFDATLTQATWERLLLWAGFAGVLLFKSESQIAGVSPYLMLQLRTKVTAFRERWVPFLASIFNHEDFKGGETLDLTPAFSSGHLYSVVELNALVTTHATNATMAPQTIREDLLGLDDRREGRRMKAAHEDRLAYTPAFEPRQGLTPNPDASDASPRAGGENPPQPGPGRPPETSA